MSRKLEGKIAVITGGSSGIGLATANRFINEGRIYSSQDAGKANWTPHGEADRPQRDGRSGDVSKPADIDKLYVAAKEQKGKLDIVFANAGIGEFAPLGQITGDHFDKQFNVNVRTIVYRAEGVAVTATGWIYRAERVDCFDDRESGLERLQCDQGGGAFACALSQLQAIAPRSE